MTATTPSNATKMTMASLETRLSALEASFNEGDDYTRPLTDAERAVRLAHTFNGPDTVRRTKVLEFLRRTGASASEIPSNGGLRAGPNWPENQLPGLPLPRRG